MDKVTSKDVFQANRDRATPLLTKLKSEGIGHMIDETRLRPQLDHAVWARGHLVKRERPTRSGRRLAT